MDSKFSFLDQDDLFNDGGGATGDVSRQSQQGRAPQMPAAAGGLAAGMAGPGPQQGPPPPRQQQQQPPPPSDGFVEALDSIARALAYTEKRVASAEARLLAALQDRPALDKKGGWGGGALAVFGGLVLLFLLVGLGVACAKRGSAGNVGVGMMGGQQMPMIVRAGPGPTPLVLQQGMMGPPNSFLS